MILINLKLSKKFNFSSKLFKKKSNSKLNCKFFFKLTHTFSLN